MSQNNFMYEWRKAKEHYDTLSDGSVLIHEDAPENVKRSYQEYERIMGKVNSFPKMRSSLFSFKSKDKDVNEVKSTSSVSVAKYEKNKNIKAIFDANDKMNITKKILTSLPNWFGIESSINEYVEKSAFMPFWAYQDNGEAIGFIAVKKHNEDSAEVYVMGVLDNYHRKHIGYNLLKECEQWCRSDGIKYLQVKTVSEDSADEFYAQTRAFYKAVGFSSLEVFPTLWDEHNPCLLMIKKL